MLVRAAVAVRTAGLEALGIAEVSSSVDFADCLPFVLTDDGCWGCAGGDGTFGT